MKKLAALITTIMFLIMAAASAELQPRLTVVCEIDYQNDVVYVQDCVGFIWSFYGAEDWLIGDYCNLIISWDEETHDIRTGEIICAEYERIPGRCCD